MLAGDRKTSSVTLPGGPRPAAATGHTGLGKRRTLPPAEPPARSFDTTGSCRAKSRAGGLAAAASVLRSRRFHEEVIVCIIVIAAMLRFGRERRPDILARLAAWDKRQEMGWQRSRRATAARR
jgi:hypothetical protein